MAGILVASFATPVATQSLLVRAGSQTGKATTTLEKTFGGEPIVIVTAPLSQTLGSVNLLKLVKLEGQIAKLRGVRAVFGPGTFVNATVTQIETVGRRELGAAADTAEAAAQAAVAKARREGADAATATRRGEEARLEALGPLRQQYQALLVRLGAIGVPTLDNAAFVRALVFGASTTPKRRFQWLFPDASHALVLVRLRPGLSDSALGALGTRIRSLTRAAALVDTEMSVAGAPLLAASVADDVAGEVGRLAPVLALMMLLILAVGLRPGRHVAGLFALSTAAAAITAGLTVLAGLGLSAATVAALPVVLGLALDFAVQLQARHWALRREGSSPQAAAEGAVQGVGAVLALASFAMCAGFLLLALSPVPLVSRLGLTLAVGVLTSFVVVVGCGPSLLMRADHGTHAPPSLRLTPPRVSPGVLTAVGAMLATLAIAGLALAGSSPIETDIAKLSRSDSPELKSVTALQKELGSAGALRIRVSAADVTSPAVVSWMTAAQTRMLRVDRRLVPGPDPAALLTGGQSVPDAASLKRLARLIPAYFLDAVISRDRRTAELSVGVPLAPVAEQARIVQGVRRAIGSPPAGIDAQEGGLVASGVAAVDGLRDSREAILLGSLFAVFLLLFAVRRNLARALVPLAPAIVVAGLSAFVIRLADLELLPLGAALEPLVLAVGLEFGLLLEARYREFRVSGRSREDARRAAREAVGGAVAVSAATVALAFLVLAVARLPLLRQFGWLVCVELIACAVVAVMIVPGLAAWADRAADGARGTGRPCDDGQGVASGGCGPIGKRTEMPA